MLSNSEIKQEICEIKCEEPFLPDDENAAYSTSSLTVAKQTKDASKCEESSEVNYSSFSDLEHFEFVSKCKHFKCRY